MTRLQTARRSFLIAAASMGLALAVAAPARAQSQDDLFNPETMQELRLTINSRDLRDLRTNFEQDTYYTADLQWRNIRVRSAGVRSRGGASRNPLKLGLRVDFDRYVTGQKFLGLKSIVLKNLWQDGSMMHERIAMAFFARMGQPASRQSFCRLYINNELQGLYVIVESVDNSYLDRTLGEHAGYLYSYQFQGPSKASTSARSSSPTRRGSSRRATRKKGTRSCICPSTTGCVK